MSPDTRAFPIYKTESAHKELLEAMDGQAVYVEITHYVDQHYVRRHCEEEGMISGQWVFGSEL